MNGLAADEANNNETSEPPDADSSSGCLEKSVVFTEEVLDEIAEQVAAESVQDVFMQEMCSFRSEYKLEDEDAGMGALAHCC